MGDIELNVLQGDDCIMKQQGLQLRSLCDQCNGRPTRGQRKLKKGQFMCVEGDDASYLFPVIEGFLKETCSLEDGRVQGIRLVGPGDVVGAEALIGDHYHSTVEALMPVRACAVPKLVTEQTLGEDANQGKALSMLLAKEILELKRSMLLLGSMSAEERIVLTLQRFAATTQFGSWVRLPMTRFELAELLGLSLGTVSRTVQKLAHRGDIEVRGRMIRFHSDDFAATDLPNTSDLVPMDPIDF